MLERKLKVAPVTYLGIRQWVIIVCVQHVDIEDRIMYGFIGVIYVTKFFVRNVNMKQHVHIAVLVLVIMTILVQSVISNVH